MPRCRAASVLAFAACAVLGAGLGGCSNTAQMFESANEGGYFSRPVTLFTTPDWARPSNTTVSLGPSGPVAPEDLLGADGRCSLPVVEAKTPEAAPAPAAEAAPVEPPPPVDRPIGSMAGDLAGPPMPAGPPPAPRPTRIAVATPQPPPDGLQIGDPPMGGGIALGMSECEAVRRAGQPSSVNIAGDEKGERKVVVTYLTGSRPGIYTFVSGRLKEVDRAPEPPAPAKPAKKIVKKKPAKSATSNTGSVTAR